MHIMRNLTLHLKRQIKLMLFILIFSSSSYFTNYTGAVFSFYTFNFVGPIAASSPFYIYISILNFEIVLRTF